MRIPTALLIASLGANAIVGLALVSRPTETAAFFRTAFARASGSVRDAKATTTVTRATAVPENVSPSTVALDQMNWAKLRPEDFAAIGAKLAALGIPPETVRAFTAVLIHQQYAQQRRALRPRPDPSEYWRNPHPRAGPDVLAAERELEREKNKVMREVVGTDFDFDDDASAQRRRYGNLSEEKITKLKKIFTDYTDLEEQLFADGVDRNSAESRARSALLAKEKRADIERLLTPDELLDYDLRNSPGAQRLRGKLGAFQATEAEFRAIFPAYQSAAEADAAAGQPGPGRVNFAEARRAREAAERRLEEEVRRVLGETRYAELQEANDQGLQQTRDLVASLNLSPAAVTQVVAIQKDFQPRLTAVERDRDLTPNQRDAQLGALAIEARTRLIQVLGNGGFEAYKRHGGGWLGLGLSRAAPTPSLAP